MRPLSIGRIALLYLGLFSMLLLGVSLYVWNEIGQTSRQLQSQELDGAKAELVEAMAAVNKRVLDIGNALATWDETKQQLVFPEYYSLWRDSRVRDAGMLPSTADSVALYDKNGNILARDNATDPLPTRLAGNPPLSYLKLEQEHHNLLVFLPVYADPGQTVLLGYIGLKFDVLAELANARAFRYADLRGLKINYPNGQPIPVEKFSEHMSIPAQSNPELTRFADLLSSSMLRLGFAIVAAIALAAFLLNRLLIKPLRHLSLEIDALRDPTVKIPVSTSKAMPLRVLELENVRDSLNDYQSRLAELHTNLEQNSRDFYDQARQDSLTGAFNRRAFDEDWRNVGEDRRLDSVALLLFDCDHFKAINDTYGHNVGDAVIQAVAQCLLKALRAGDRLYRIGGDEFATIIPDADRALAQTVAERCLAHILTHDFREHGVSEPMTISIGVALSNDEDTQKRCELNELQKRADLAMYAAKRPGGQKIMFYSTKLGSVEALVANHAINAVFQAIQDPDLIHMVYQPIIRLPQTKLEYAEALTRIRTDDGLLYPNSIFPIIEDRNLDAEFDLAILRAIHSDMVSGKLPAGHGVSINVSAAGIVNSHVMDTLIGLLEAEQNRKIVIEITETALITQMELATANIRRLQAVGALVALDDFGSGYSSLRYLASMPVDLVKFDISMIRLLLSGDARQVQMLEEIARMVIAAGYELVAEGIETRELLDQVIKLGFSHAQGYYFGKPGEALVNAN